MVVAFYNAPWGSIYFLNFSRFDLVGDCHFTILQIMKEYLIVLIHIVPQPATINHHFFCHSTYIYILSAQDSTLLIVWWKLYDFEFTLTSWNLRLRRSFLVLILFVFLSLLKYSVPFPEKYIGFIETLLS